MGSRRKPFVFRVKRKDSTLTLTPECEVVEVEEDEKALIGIFNSNYHHQAARNLYTMRWDVQNPQQVSAGLNLIVDDETWVISKLQENEYSLLKRLITVFCREFRTLIISVRGHPFRIEVSHDSTDDLDYFKKQYESGEVEKTLMHHLVTPWTDPDVPCNQQTCDRVVASQESQKHGLISETKTATQALHDEDTQEFFKATQDKHAMDRLLTKCDTCASELRELFEKTELPTFQFLEEHKHLLTFPQDKEENISDAIPLLNQNLYIKETKSDTNQQLSCLQSDVDLSSDQETPSDTPPAEQTVLEQQSSLNEQIEPAIHHVGISDISVSPGRAVYAETSQEIGESTADLQEQLLNQHLKRGKAETERAIAETERATTETKRFIAETEGAATETMMATTETMRATSKIMKATTKRERAATETLRATTETMRTIIETMRDSAETMRATAEREKATVETMRATTEAKRAIAEAEKASTDAAMAREETLKVQLEIDLGGD